MQSDKEIFQNGSTTYYWSSTFFPRRVRDDVFKLYSFVRVVDDLIDQKKPDTQSFERVVKRWKTIKRSLGKPSKKVDDSALEHVLANIAYVVHRYECEPAWVDAFLKSMQMDLDKRRYFSLKDTQEYMYGSAEVIGLMMAKIMGLPEAATEYARLQGRAMQYINFIRDIADDMVLGRAYFPAEELTMFGLKDLSKKEAHKKPAEFREFIEFQLHRYGEWQTEAAHGFRYIPRRQRAALRTAVDMYNWTAEKIKEDPFVVYEHRVKPTKQRVVLRGVVRSLYA